MGNLYPGDSTNYPTNIDTPADGEKANAAVFDRPHQNEADRTAYLRRRMLQHLAIDIPHRVVVGADQNFGAAYAPNPGEVWVVGGWDTNAQVYKSRDMGATFARETAIDAVIVTNPSHFYGVAASGISDVIVVGSAAHFYAYDRAAASWYADGWTSPGIFTKIVYATPLDRFFVVGVTGGNLTAKRTDPADIHNMNNPTTQIAAGGWSNLATGLAVNPNNGHVVAAGITTGNAPRVAYSTDGGANWVTLAALVSTIALPDEISVAYHDGYFYLFVGESVGTFTGEVWRSADSGATWTLMLTTTTDYVAHALSFGDRLVGVTRGGQIVTAVGTGGTTWRRAGVKVDNVIRGVCNANGRAVFHTASRVETSFYVGSDEALTGASVLA